MAVSSAQRVAARHIQAAFLSDKWLRAQKVALKAILNSKVRKDVDWWGFDFPDKVIPWFDNFQRGFEEIVSQDQARESIQGRVQSAKTYVEAITDKLNKLTELTKNVDFKNPVSFLRWFAAVECHQAITEKVETIGDLFKWSYYIDESIIDRLVQKTLKVATPEEIQKFTDENDSYGRKYEVLYRIRYKEQALKALKRNKLDAFDPTKWVDRIQEMLAANYSEEALKDEETFREFDLFGMKVVIDDRSVAPAMAKLYVKYLTEAHQALKAKGFGKAWYGTVFIQCQTCGGVNQNTGGGTGGLYQIGKDTVSIFSRPSQFIVELVVHELGHRFWFKQMRPAQRSKFESLVKVHTIKRPGQVTDVRPFKEQELKPIKRNIEEHSKKFESLLKTGYHQELHNIAFDVVVEATMLTIDDDAKTAVKAQADDLYNARFKTDKELDAFEDNRSDAEKVQFEFDALVAAALIYVDYAAQKHNELLEKKLTPEGKAWLDSYEQNPNPVLPVSNYAKSNIDEAWAEMFAHYVLDRGTLTRDQVDSFRSVLKLSTLDRVLERFLTPEG